MFIGMSDIRMTDFFIGDNEVKLQEELDYGATEEYVRMAEAFSRSTFLSVYIIDYFRKDFLYVSPNPAFLCGLSPEEMKKMGYRVYIEYVPEEEQQLLLDINRAGFSFFNTIPEEQRKDFFIQYDFHMMQEGRKVLIHHKLTPIALTSDGRIWLALCVVSASNHTTPGHVRICRTGSSDYYELNPITKRWDKRSMPKLTEGEKSVILLSIQGLTMSEIADRMCLSTDTIKKYRRQIFEKLGVRNISEAIMAAANSKLI